MRISHATLKNLAGLAMIFALLFIVCNGVHAQTSGKIAGVVIDQSTGDGLPGVNVIVDGTNLGASTDSQGRYFILNVPPGVYTVRASFIGYRVKNLQDIRVSVGQTAEANFALESTVIEGEEVVVTAERPLVERDRTVSVSKYDTEELNNNLPVADVQEIVETSPSVYRGFVRGGAKYETKTLVDGVDVSDAFWSRGQGQFGQEPGHTYLSMRPSDDNDNTGAPQNAGALQEVQVFAGVFNAEYPAATAGIVNIVTKEGGQNFSFNLFNRTQLLSGKEHAGRNIYWDAPLYFAERDEYAASGSAILIERASLYTWSPDKARENYNYDPADSTTGSRSHETSFTISGPLTSKGGFFFEGGYSQIDGALPFERTKRINGSLKLHYNLAAGKKLVGSFSVRDGGELFNFVNWKYNPRYKYYIEGAPRYKDINTVGYMKYTHSLSSKSFFEVQVSNTHMRNRVGYPDDDGDGFPTLDEKGDFIDFDSIEEYIKYVGGNGTFGTENGFVFGDTTRTQRVFFSSTLNPAGWQKLNQAQYSVLGTRIDGFYITSYPLALYQDFKRSKLTFKGDFTSQVNYNNQIKAGLSYSVLDIDVNSLTTELGGRGRQFPTSHFHVNQYQFKPKEVSAYIQDKIEFEGLIVNIGARVDGFDNDTENFLNDFDPLDEVREGGELLERIPKRGDKVGFKFFFSPRLGVSHPVTENLAMHYSFGRFFQYPNYATLYTDYNFTDYAASPTTRTVNPEQEPVRSTNYEIGAQWSFGRDYLLNATAYYRDVNYTGSQSITLTTREGVGLTFQTTWGYSDSRGIEIELSKRPSKWWAGRISYAHSYVKESIGAGSDPTIQTAFNAAVDSANYSSIPYRDLQRLPSRERNVLVTSGGTNNILSGGYDRPHRVSGTLQFFMPADFNLTAVGEWSSGFYYLQFANVENDPFFRRNDNLKIGPSTLWFNARLSKMFNFGTGMLELYVEGRNLFNRENIRSISNGSITNTNMELEREIWEQGRPDGQGGRLTEPETDPEGIIAQPVDAFGRLYYENMREFYFGMKFNFR